MVCLLDVFLIRFYFEVFWTGCRSTRSLRNMSDLFATFTGSCFVVPYFLSSCSWVFFLVCLSLFHIVFFLCCPAFSQIICNSFLRLHAFTHWNTNLVYSLALQAGRVAHSQISQPPRNLRSSPFIPTVVPKKQWSSSQCLPVLALFSHVFACGTAAYGTRTRQTSEALLWCDHPHSERSHGRCFSTPPANRWENAPAHAIRRPAECWIPLSKWSSIPMK